jgi:hypothetical protein
MVESRESYLQTLDNLLHAGSAGERLQARHLPHIDQLKTELARLATPHVAQTEDFRTGVYTLGEVCHRVDES